MKGLAASVVIVVGIIAGLGSPLSAAPDQEPRRISPTSFKLDMRRVWSDHVIWTRAYIVAATSGGADHQAAAARLMRNQDDIGSAMAEFYGKSMGGRLTVLLRRHISIAVDFIRIAKAGDRNAQEQTDDLWQQNAMDIAELLSLANPNWPLATMMDMMKRHLATTTAEIAARLNKTWDDDVRTFDAVHDHILLMSDVLADGIIRQFPDRFAPN